MLCLFVALGVLMNLVRQYLQQQAKINIVESICFPSLLLA
jgi:hypothetical protein